MTSQSAPGAQLRTGSRIAPDTQRNSNLPPLPSGSITTSPALKFGNIAQALINVLAAVCIASIPSLFGVAASLLLYAAYLRLVPQSIQY